MNMESNINRNILKVRYTVRLKSRSFRQESGLLFMDCARFRDAPRKRTPYSKKM